jgi:hypothetical protein
LERYRCKSSRSDNLGSSWQYQRSQASEIAETVLEIRMKQWMLEHEQDDWFQGQANTTSKAKSQYRGMTLLVTTGLSWTLFSSCP